jgi:hypothetical protein
MNNWDMFYGGEDSGNSGTTGANFIAGNTGYRFPDYGKELLDTLFGEDDMDLF